MNSKNEYNRCSIPRLSLEVDTTIDKYVDEKEDREIKSKIIELKEKIRNEGREPKRKKQKLCDLKVKCDKIIKKGVSKLKLRQRREGNRCRNMISPVQSGDNYNNKK